MNSLKDTAIIIPSRIGSTRLEKKPLAIIEGKVLIERVYNQVKSTGLANIFIATDSEEIYSLAEKIGAKPIMTDSSCSTGTDRVYDCYKKINDNGAIKYIVNIQGDMPFISPETIKSTIKLLRINKFDIVTPVVRTSKKNVEGFSNVKVVTCDVEKMLIDTDTGKTVDIVSNGVGTTNKEEIEFSSAVYFSRSLIPYSAEEFLYHIGIYGFTSDSIKKFCNLPQSYLEKTENLEQLRALENGMSIGVCYVDDIPISVDTKEDLEKAIEKCKNFPQ
jgi:3-deoxy-manno-octulosonate cytidylyltransferase (CMP-KDO synthetase)